KNSMYRMTVKNTQEFDRQILKRYVNFMSNPDEETAINQFGSGDKYFGVCTMMVTMPGLPMFGHGQIEGFTEKYGMEYRRSYRDEKPDQALIGRHEREIFPLLHLRRLFAGVDRFYFYDFFLPNGHVDENVFAYSNGLSDERVLVFFNNRWERTWGRISMSCQYASGDGSGSRRLHRETLVQALDLDAGPGNFLVVREMKTGLWHVYSCAEFQTDGWAVQLEGYEAKVFVDFMRVHDFDGSYGKLHAAFGGKGIADLDSALEEASKPELYHALSETLGSLLGFSALSESKDTAQEQILKAIAATGEVSERFFSWLAQTIDAEGGPQPAIGAVTMSRTTLEHGMAFVAGLKAKAFQVNGAGEPKPAKDQTDEAIESFKKVARSDRGLKALLYHCFIYAVAQMQGFGNPTEELRYILDKFLLRKKMLESLGRARPEGTREGESCQEIPELALDRIDDNSLCSIIFAFATRPMRSIEPPGSRYSSGRQTGDRAIDLLRWADTDVESRSALGINNWEGVEYFSQEKMEAMLELVPVFAATEKYLDLAGQTRLDTAQESIIREKVLDDETYAVFAVCGAIRSMEESSGFRMDKLISLLADAIS
ncbi:MAG: hypothetical protein LLF89_04270, partial [Spirochaetaceae bacterium]|nr:hypothetical protein [Spirochaetaceae bacterium]